MPDSPAISAVIPVHNEASFIGGALPRLVAALESVDRSFEVIVAENGSTDDTARMATEATAGDDRISVMRLAEADYGAAMRAGFLAASGDWVVNFDIDYFSAEFLRAGFEVADSADLILASKRVHGADDRRSALRRLGTWGFTLMVRLLLRSKVTDTHGMKMVRRSVVDRVVPSVRSTEDLFDTELVVRAERQGFRIAEVPAVVEEMRTARSSLIGRVPRTVWGLLRIRRQLRKEARSGDL